MKAVILAGGKGERLRPITNNIAKPMVSVQGKPVLQHLLELLKKHNIVDIIISVSYLPHTITEYFGDGKKYGVNIEYLYEDPKNPLGTAGAIYPLASKINDNFIVVYSDILRDLDITKMIEKHLSEDPIATINVYKEFDAIPRSQIIIDSEENITKFIEHPNITNKNGSFVHTNGSFYILNSKIFEYLGSKVPLDFSKDVFPKLIEEKHKLLAFPTNGYFLDIGTKEKLALAQKTYNYNI